jgi:hypothetical protein
MESDIRWGLKDPESGHACARKTRLAAWEAGSEAQMGKRERWVLLKIPRRDIDGVGEGK